VPTPVAAFVRLVTGVNRLLFFAAAGLMAVVIPAMLYEVTSRYGFDAPTVWGMELATLLFGPYFLLGGPYLLHQGGHVNLDLVHRRLPARWRRAVDLLNFPVIVFFCGVLLVYSWPLAVQSWEFGETSFSAWNPPVWPFKFAIPLAVLLMLLQALAEFLRVLFRDPAREAAREAARQAAAAEAAP